MPIKRQDSEMRRTTLVVRPEDIDLYGRVLRQLRANPSLGDPVKGESYAQTTQDISSRSAQRLSRR